MIEFRERSEVALSTTMIPAAVLQQDPGPSRKEREALHKVRYHSNHPHVPNRRLQH